MITGSISAQAASLSAWTTTARGCRGGATNLSLRTSHHHVNHSAMPIIRPGAIPAMNSLEIDTLAATPKMIRPMEGGSTGAMMPVAAIRPPARALS